MKTTLLLFFLTVISLSSALALDAKQMTNEDTLFFYFEVGSSDYIQNESTNKNIELILSSQFESVKFFACTDSTGSKNSNDILAQNRLENIKTNTTFNSGETTFNVIGESNQFNPLDKNRCVYIVVTSKKTEIVKRPVEKKDTLLLNLSFVPGEAALFPSSLPIIDEMFLMFDTISFSQVQLHGHVCCGWDQNLSFNRAKTVENILIQYGIPARKIKCFGHSNDEPKVPENSEANKQINRRVELIIFP